MKRSFLLALIFGCFTATLSAQPWALRGIQTVLYPKLGNHSGSFGYFFNYSEEQILYKMYFRMDEEMDIINYTLEWSEVEDVAETSTGRIFIHGNAVRQDKQNKQFTTFFICPDGDGDVTEIVKRIKRLANKYGDAGLDETDDEIEDDESYFPYEPEAYH